MCLVEARTLKLVDWEWELNGQMTDRCETACGCFRGDGTARTDHQHTSSFSCLLTCHPVICGGFVLQGFGAEAVVRMDCCFYKMISVQGKNE